jgi:hypothetical protein
MSDLADEYRRTADQARSEAAATPLPNVREVHLRSAEQLDKMFVRMNNVARARSRNDEAKRN